LNEKFSGNAVPVICEIIKNQLELWDDQIMIARDRSNYRHKGKRKTVKKTVMGEVEYTVQYTMRQNKDGKGASCTCWMKR
jgi:hypothetical protein